MGNLRSRRSGLLYATLDSTSRPSSPSNKTYFQPTSLSSKTWIPSPAYESTPFIRSYRSDCRTLEVTHAQHANFLLSIPPEPYDNYPGHTTPVFHVRNNTSRKLGPSITLTDKSKDGNVLGIVKLRWGRSDLFGVGASESTLRWEKLQRISPATHSRYEFEYNFGPAGGGRRKFIWRRNKATILGHQPDLELREILGWGLYGAWGSEAREVLASYTGMRWGPWKRHGKLRIKRGAVGGDGVRFERFQQQGDEKWGEWETVVTLTAMAILEGARRRVGTAAWSTQTVPKEAPP